MAWYDYEDVREGRPEIYIIWRCDKCGREREEPEGYNEGGQCTCGGTWLRHAESY